MKPIVILDTTLRDGMQGTGINYTLEDKIQIARQLDDFRIDFIEGGFPLSNRKEAEFFRRMKSERLQHARVASFGSTRRPNHDAEKDPNVRALLDAETEAVVIVGKAWTEHVRNVLKTSLEENLRMVYDSVALLKRHGLTVIFDLEHFFQGYDEDPQYALKVLEAGTEAGADNLVLCDTNGGMLPSDVSRIIRDLPQERLAPLGIHCHDDTGTAVASSLAAVEAGAVHVQGTINGWGERCGNANLCVVIPNLCLKMGRVTSSADNLRRLTSLSRFVAEKANLIPEKRQPYVGEAAFSHKAGQHADVILKAAHLMEHISGELVGNERKLLLSELAGKSTVMKKMAKYGNFDKSSQAVQELTERLKALEEQGYEYEAAEASFDLVIRKSLGRYQPLFELRNYHLESFKATDSPAKTVGRIFLQADSKELMGAAAGLGPVETLDYCLRDALAVIHPFMQRIKLVDFAVRVLDPERATAAKVRVFITSSDGEKTWNTVGVSENVIEASWQALIDALDYYYNNHVIENNGNGSSQTQV
ncbi:MAG: citramalate synthase [Spirochaetales bacterium]|nr:citramalate synthase [Spirochaetales bacterium]